MRLKIFKKKWKDCQRCPLSKCRFEVVLYRGSIPADILFIGEAPGDSENVIGKPFVGPAGDLLDSILADVNFFDGHVHPITRSTYCITNIIACIPLNKHGDTRKPKKEEIQACQERLVDFIRIVKPKLIVTLGKIAKSNLPTYIIEKGIPVRSIIHPAALLPGRMEDSRRRVAVRRVVFQLNRWLEGVEGVLS